MKTLFLEGHVSLSMVAEGLKIREGDESRVISPPYLPFDAVVIQNAFGYVSFAALRILLSLRIAVAMLDYQGRVLGYMSPYARREGDLRIRQLRASDDPGKRLAIARGIVQRGYRRRGAYVPVSKASTVKELMKLESEAAEAYWTRWRERLGSAWPEHDFDGRENPRYRASFRAVTRTNAVLNYSYALLETACRTAIHRVGLLPDVGFLHVERARTDPLVYDLMELGRGWVDDAVLDYFRKPENRKGFKRTAEWVTRLSPEKIRDLVRFVSPRIRAEILWHDARDIVKRL